MELTGKCKDAFEKWACENGFCVMSESNGLSYDYSESWYDLPKAMQYGVYVDFFDSVGIFIQISFYDFDGFNWQICLECTDSNFDYNETHLVSRQEARTEAIKKANEIFNNG